MPTLAGWLARMDESARVRASVLVALVALAFAAIGPLVDDYHQFAFEADAHLTVALAQGFAGIVTTRKFPELLVGIPYFEAQYWIYALGYAVAKGVNALGWLDPATFPTNQSLAILAIRGVNVAAQAGAVALAYLAFARLGRSTLVAFALGTLFLLDPQLLGIDMLRIDRLILFLFVLVFCLCLEIVAGRRSRWLDAGVGVSTALLAMTKITCGVFVAVPLFAYACQRRVFKAPLGHVATFGASFVIAALLISVRYFVHLGHSPGGLWRFLVDKFVVGASWGAVLPREPYLYYNWDVFLPLGTVFMAVFLAALGICAFAALIRRDAIAGFVLAPLAIQSALGIVAFKYPRGGYLLMPMYLFAIAYAAGFVGERLPRLRIVPLAMVALLVLPLRHAWIAYEQARDEAAARNESIQVTRIAPREWFIRNVRPGARVAIFRDSEWANPPIEDLGYALTNALLYFPYLEPDKMGVFLPPDPGAIGKDVDIVVLNGFHKSVYVSYMRNAGHEKVAAEWERFFAELFRRYPHQHFKAKHPNYLVDEVDIVVVNPVPPASR